MALLLAQSKALDIVDVALKSALMSEVAYRAESIQELRPVNPNPVAWLNLPKLLKKRIKYMVTDISQPVATILNLTLIAKSLKYLLYAELSPVRVLGIRLKENLETCPKKRTIILNT